MFLRLEMKIHEGDGYMRRGSPDFKVWRLKSRRAAFCIIGRRARKEKLQNMNEPWTESITEVLPEPKVFGHSLHIIIIEKVGIT
ncbi:hypothetical protein R1flu_000253 [Riccia fluitans]|uniref:Uncharacterized protein n=1 Tax=Riccia fluitans TaxID=41844 RepID=A0ABD1XZW9_9MARC